MVPVAEIPDFDRITKLPAVPRFTCASVDPVVDVVELDPVENEPVVAVVLVVENDPDVVELEGAVVSVVAPDVVPVVDVDPPVDVGIVDIGTKTTNPVINTPRITAAEIGIKLVRFNRIMCLEKGGHTITRQRIFCNES